MYMGGMGLSIKDLVKKHPFVKLAQKQPKLIPLLAPLTPLPVKHYMQQQKVTPGELLKKEYVESVMKPLSKIDPIMKKHYQHEQRLERSKAIKGELATLQTQPPSAERDQRINALMAELNAIADDEKKYIKQGKIVAAIATVVVGIFTFGGGSVAIQGAYEALKSGAIALGKKLLAGALASAISKGLSKDDAKKAQDAIDTLEQYPPNPELDSLDAMIKDSYSKRDAAAEKTGWIIPAGIVAALMFLS